MKRFLLAGIFALLTGGVSTPCLAQTQFHWGFDEPFVTLSSGHHVVTATVYNTGTNPLALLIGVPFEITLAPDFLAAISNPTVGPTSSVLDFNRQFLLNPDYPIAPGTSFQFAAFNFDYDGPDRVYTDVVTDGYLALSGVSVAPSNSISFSFESAVPEPSTWLLMITGFGLIGAAMRTAGPVRRPLTRLKRSG